MESVFESLRLAPGKLWLETQVLPAYLIQCRWFAGKNRDLQSITICDQIASPEGEEWMVYFLEVQYADGGSETYLLPLAYAATQHGLDLQSAEMLQTPGPNPFFAHPNGFLYEAIHHSGFRTTLINLMASQGELQGQNGILRGRGMPTHFMNLGTGSFKSSHVLKAEQSNTAFIYPEGFFLKLLRRLQKEENPELEILRFFEGETDFRNVPRLAGWLEYSFSKKQFLSSASPSASESVYTLAIAEGLLQFQMDAWKYALKLANHYLDQNGSPLEFMGQEFARLLGQRTAEMHLALASQPQSPNFKPEPFTWEYQKILGEGIEQHFEGVFKNLARIVPQLQGEAQTLAQKVWNSQALVMKSLDCLKSELFATVTIRIHGDYHLGQVLITEKDVVILDFEGEPSRPLAFRKQKRSPWCDVAGMLRSFHYAIHSANMTPRANALFGGASNTLDQDKSVESWPEKMAKSFLEAYLKAAGKASFIPPENQQKALLQLYLMEKALYELDYEMNHRPTWVQIPLRGILKILEKE